MGRTKGSVLEGEGCDRFLIVINGREEHHAGHGLLLPESDRKISGYKCAKHFVETALNAMSESFFRTLVYFIIFGDYYVAYLF
jgi:hypothetical protein